MSEPEITSTILLVDDDEGLNRLVVKYLTKNGFQVDIETNGAEAVERIVHEQPMLVILDIMLPDLDGLSICRYVRTRYSGPILMLTALGEDIDEVAGLETGADDYLAKPVRPRVLLARIRSLLRRYSQTQAIEDNHEENSLSELPGGEKQALAVGDLRILTNSRSVYLRDRAIRLTSAEFDLLWLLASHAGEVLNRNTIHQQLRGLDYDGVDRTIDLRISRIRKKLGDDSKDPQMIKSIRGVGYIFTQ
jgi:DNA-binding response OmpR family regulator